MMLPRISIVMPSYNQGPYLEQALLSVLSQDYPDIELIVIDGGSVDETKQILQKFDEQIAFWSSEPDGGQADALNKGFKKVSGDILGWLNSDDTLEPGTFNQVARVFSDKDINIAMCTDIGFIDAEGRLFDKKINRFGDHETLVRFWTTDGMTISQPSVFFRRKIVKNFAPLFDTELHYAMDYDLWLRITREHPIHMVDGHWANYRFHESNKSGRGFDAFYPEWLCVSKRYWGEKHSTAWLKNYVHFTFSRIRNSLSKRISHVTGAER